MYQICLLHQLFIFIRNLKILIHTSCPGIRFIIPIPFFCQISNIISGSPFYPMNIFPVNILILDRIQNSITINIVSYGTNNIAFNVLLPATVSNKIKCLTTWTNLIHRIKNIDAHTCHGYYFFLLIRHFYSPLSINNLPFCICTISFNIYLLSTCCTASTRNM